MIRQEGLVGFCQFIEGMLDIYREFEADLILGMECATSIRVFN